MDSFMDKLAQKLTAQEMIKANSAADAEEMKKLKSQIKEYRDILDQMQKLVADSAEKIENAKVDGSEINRLVDESIAKINQIQVASQDNEGLQVALEQLQQSVGAKQEQLQQSVEEKLEQLKQSVEQNSANENWDELEQSIDMKMIVVGENIHKECVKVYRNVQAVVVEENGKQTESVVAAVKELKGKFGPILGVSVAALIVSIISIVFQVLVYLHVI